MDSLLLGITAALCFVFGWNNSSFLIGNLRGSGSFSYRSAVGVSIAGLFLGVILEGPKMTKSLAGTLAPGTETVLLATVAVSFILTLAITLLRLPLSFSMVMVGAFMGAALASAFALKTSRAEEIIGFWALAPAVTAPLTFAIFATVNRVVSRLGLLTVDIFNRATGFVSALAVSFTLGANNIGLFYGMSLTSAVAQTEEIELLLLLTAVAVLGVLAFGKNALGGTIGDRMMALSPQGVFSAFLASSIVVWAGTQLALPVSITQCLLGGMLGAAYTRDVTIVNTKLVWETLSMWVVAPVVALVLAYLAVALL